MHRELRIGTRGSKLALRQAMEVKEELKKHTSADLRPVIIRTTGDRFTDRPVYRLGEKGVFIKEIEEALLDGRIDLAVHSMKDLPVILRNGLKLAAITRRIEYRDAFISSTGLSLEELASGSGIGTGSIRRTVLLKDYREDLEVLPLRGNLDTRLKKLSSKEYDGIVVAAAGLIRMGWEDRITHLLREDHFLPSSGQGALGIEIRKNDRDTLDQLRALDHGPTSSAIQTERAFLDTIGGGCTFPVGVFARSIEPKIHLRAFWAEGIGSRVFRFEGDGPSDDPCGLGIRLGEKFKEEIGMS